MIPKSKKHEAEELSKKMRPSGQGWFPTLPYLLLHWMILKRKRERGVRRESPEGWSWWQVSWAETQWEGGIKLLLSLGRQGWSRHVLSSPSRGSEGQQPCRDDSKRGDQGRASTRRAPRSLGLLEGLGSPREGCRGMKGAGVGQLC